MIKEVSEFLINLTKEYSEKDIEAAKAYWESSIDASDEKIEITEKKEEIFELFLSNKEVFDKIRFYRMNKEEFCSLTNRQLNLFYNEMLENQITEEEIKVMVHLESELEKEFANFRPEVDGKKITDNDINEVLENCNDSEKRENYWKAGHRIGERIHSRLIDLIKLRNKAARKLGYENYYVMAFESDELNVDEIHNLFKEIELKTEKSFTKIKKELDAKLADRFKTSSDNIYPWHYSDLFFQTVPMTNDVDLNVYFKGKNIEELTRKTYSSLGMNINDLIEKADLYEKEGKNQHAYCMDVDRKEDIRVLCNVKDNERWMSTMLHEFGHAVYDKYIDKKLPYIVRTSAHTFTTEAAAMFMEKFTKNIDWLRDIAEIDAKELEEKLNELEAFDVIEKLIIVRWIISFVFFEKELYEDPDNPDLNKKWWEIRKRIQQIDLPEERKTPDWAAKIHFALSPVYYHNYLLGEIFAAQLRLYIKENISEKLYSEPVGKFLRDNVFFPGAKYKWNDMIIKALKEELNADYLLKEIT